MGYQTYFNGELEIQLNEPELSNLKEYISKQLKNKDAVVANKHFLLVQDEWKDRGLMEELVLFIENKGVLKSGSILCEGEDSKDSWEIFIANNKPLIREHGSAITLSRAESKLKTVTEL